MKLRERAKLFLFTPKLATEYTKLGVAEQGDAGEPEP
jgi:hypothetical protein